MCMSASCMKLLKNLLKINQTIKICGFVVIGIGLIVSLLLLSVNDQIICLEADNQKNTFSAEFKILNITNLWAANTSRVGATHAKASSQVKWSHKNPG